MKLIGISMRVDYIESHNEKRDTLDQRWALLFNSCGFIPFYIPNNLIALKKIIDHFPFTGIIFSGGNDLVQYGGNTPERDEVEIFLINYAIKNNLPLLGVCRGMQIIQHFFGVKLEQLPHHPLGSHKVIFKNSERIVNSTHKLGSFSSVKELLISGKSEDGVVEEIHHTEFKIKAMMWHPERFYPFANEDLLTIRNFFN